MKSRHTAMALAMLVCGMGCLHDWEKGGTMDQAMEKDFKEWVNPPPCPEGMTLVADASCEGAKDAGTCPQVCR